MKSDHHQGVSAGTHNAFATRMRWVGAGSQNFPRYCPDKAVATSVIHQWCMAWDRWHKQQPARVQGVGFDGGRMKGVQHNLTLSCFFSGNEFLVALAV
jgi:hypothetical protein